jgi:hypothetical protein
MIRDLKSILSENIEKISVSRLQNVLQRIENIVSKSKGALCL